MRTAGRDRRGVASVLTTDDLHCFLALLPLLDPDVDDAERVEQIGLLESIKAAAAGAQARATVAFAASQRETQAVAGVPRGERGRGIAAQVALARRDSPARGSRHLGLAEALVRELPHTMEHLAAGSVSEWRATIVCRETACLSPEDRGAVDEALATELPGLGDRQVEARARALASQLDAAAMAQRARRAHSERRVSLRPAPDTMTHLTALLPVAQGVAVLAALETAAASARAGGDDRGRSQLMADTLVERVTGQATAEAVPIEVQLVLPAAGGDEPARLGDQVLPAQTTLDLLASARQAGARATLREVIATTDGVDLAHVSARRRALPEQPNQPARTRGSGEPAPADGAPGRLFTGAARRFILLRDQRCRTPWCDAPIRHLDHVIATRAGGSTTTANGQGLCEACNYAKEAPGWRARTVRAGPAHTVRTTTPTGHSYDSTAPPVLPARVRARAATSPLERLFEALLLSA
ncbi:protein of unknown function [Pedococcus dokdonensis]|uniref:HNH nuclease domain-containing protein n=1 Tax=Pedococcus dokdonensis TaxID=443156 RepID=A0A1H0RY19_9MICO|nr:HNH endonuclease signature motif containing protein [Pedococcus dokdonensis]SDP34364.1 protein of unknown function [Pedococcus dokdonensis]